MPILGGMAEMNGQEPLRLKRVAQLADLRDEWDGPALGAGHPFATYEWNSIWWRYYGGDRELFTFACRDDDGRLVAILPLYIARSRPRIARLLGYADLGSPLCAPDDRSRVAAALQALTGRRARGADGCSLILLERLPGEQGWSELLGATVLRTETDPVLRIAGRSWDEFLASKSSSFRKQARYQERRLAREHDLEIRLCEDPADFDAEFDVLTALHDRRWGDVSTGVLAGERGEMQREIARAAMERGWLRLWIERVDGEPAAAYYGIRFAGSEFFYQSGRDPRFDRLSVGAVLLAHVVRDACEAGVGTFRFLAGDESYKLRLADGDFEPETVLVGSGLTGALGRAGVRAVRAMPESLRARVS